MHFRPRFWGFPKFLGVFEFFLKFLGLVLWIWWHMIMHCISLISIITMFHTFRCVLVYCWCVLVGLDFVFTHDVFIFAHHMFMPISCIHILSFLSICFCLWCVSFFSLSLYQIDCAWHPSANLLRLGTLLVLGLLLLIHPVFTFGSVMGRLSRTSLRTFSDMAFIWSVMSFLSDFSDTPLPCVIRT